MRRNIAAGSRSDRPGAVGAGTCRRWFIELYSDYRDGRLDAGTRAEVDAHLAECDSCRRYDRVVRRGVAVLRDSLLFDPVADTESGGRVARRPAS